MKRRIIKMKNFFILIFILLMICIILWIPVIYKNSNYTKNEIFDKLNESNVSLLQEKENTIEFVDRLKENNIEFYDEDLNNLQYSKFKGYCKITIFSDEKEAIKNQFILKDEKNIFREKNIIFYTNESSLKEKYLKFLRKIKGKRYD